MWTRSSEPAQRRSVIAAVTDTHHVPIDELDATHREAALTTFRTGTGWRKGADVDRLSEQEARVIADRLLRRVTAKVPSARSNVVVAEAALTETIRRLLVSGCISPQECQTPLLAAARPHFSKSELTALHDAIARGFTPVDGEK